MKQLKTILKEAQENHQSNEFEFFANSERSGEISRRTYYRVCRVAHASRDEASSWLRENYQRAGVAHLY